MTTLANLETQVRDEINESTAGFWTSAELRRYINEGNRILTRAYRLESATPQTINTVDGTESYALASDFAAPVKIELVDDTDDWTSLRRIDQKERVDGKGEPEAYYIKGTKVYFSPKPDDAYEIRVWYFVKATTLSADGDSPVIPSDYHDLIAKYAIARAKQKDDDPAYQTYDQQFEDGKREMVKDRLEEDEGADTPTTVQYVDDDWLTSHETEQDDD